jgi:hypothetical protein
MVRASNDLLLSRFPLRENAAITAATGAHSGIFHPSSISAEARS